MLIRDVTSHFARFDVLAQNAIKKSPVIPSTAEIIFLRWKAFWEHLNLYSFKIYIIGLMFVPLARTQAK